MIVNVEMNSYRKAYGLEDEHIPVRTQGKCFEDWDMMVVTSDKLIDMINKCVKIQIN